MVVHTDILGRLSLTSNTDTTDLRIVPIPNIVLIMRTRLSLGLHMDFDTFRSRPIFGSHDTEQERYRRATWGYNVSSFFYAHALGPPSSWPVNSSQLNSKQYGGTRVSANETAITFERTARFPFHGYCLQIEGQCKEFFWLENLN